MSHASWRRTREGDYPADRGRFAVWVALAITVVPLLLPLLALGNVRRALLWVGILSLFYFCHGVAESWSSPQERWLALFEIVLTLLIIGALGAGVKRKSAASPR